MRAGRLAVSAANTVRSVGLFVDRNVELADFLAGCAFCAFCLVDFKSVEGNFIENSVNCSQRTDISAERAVDYNRRNNRKNQNGKLPPEDKSRSSPHG